MTQHLGWTFAIRKIDRGGPVHTPDLPGELVAEDIRHLETAAGELIRRRERGEAVGLVRVLFSGRRAMISHREAAVLHRLQAEAREEAEAA